MTWTQFLTLLREDQLRHYLSLTGPERDALHRELVSGGHEVTWRRVLSDNHLLERIDLGAVREQNDLRNEFKNQREHAASDKHRHANSGSKP